MAFFKKIVIFIAVAVFAIALFVSFKVTYASDFILTIIAKDKSYTFTNSEIALYNGKYYLKNAKEIVEGIYLDTLKNCKDASVKFNPNSEILFTYTNEISGEELIKEALLNEIENALNSGKNSVVAKYREIKPKINVQDIKKETNFRVSFTTNYSYSNIDRKYNIQLASKKINGIILDNGEEFSFNKIVGLRTEENGFKNAKVIFNGDYVDGVGGGVCQVSTTLYNTALLSGLLITEHHPHSLQVSYVEPSFDAMVNSVSSDLKFINNTGGRLYIKSVADFNNLTISFYGIKQNEKYDRVSVVVEETACNEYLYEDDNDINFGDKVIVRIPKNGISSEGYLIKYENGVEIKNSRIRCDYYNPIKGIIKVGKKLTN